MGFNARPTRGGRATAGPVACIVISLAVALAGCDATYYKTMEVLGKAKRDLLGQRVAAAKAGQQEAKEEFQTALAKFSAITKHQGGDLAAKYEDMKAGLARCESRAVTVKKQTAQVEEVGADLFKEWESELKQYSSDDLRLQSEVKLRDTQKRYAQLLRAMKRAEQKMQPVLAALRDQVLYLKHNLNAQAVSSLQGTAEALQTDVSALVAEMEAAIREATAFIEAMGKA
jgi:hypothetical protein